MLKSIVGLLMTVSFVATANAAIEIQISDSFVGTSGGIEMLDDGTNDVMNYGFNVEAYYGLSETLQVGGVLGYSDSDATGSEATILFGVLGRFNLDADLRNAVFITGGVTYADLGALDNIAAHVGVGKRYPISETLTWTPNLSVSLNVAGDIDEGHKIALNLLSFSGFMD